MKRTLLQGAALAALAYALAQPAWAAEGALVVDNSNAGEGAMIVDNTKPNELGTVIETSEKVLVAQAAPSVPASPTLQLAQGTAMPPDPETVVVTATKRETFLQDTPIAIAVV